MSQKRPLWGIAIVLGVLLGLGIGQLVRFQEATADSQENGHSHLTEELERLKTKHRALQAKWQSSLLAHVAPTLADESDAVKRQFVDLLEELGTPGVPALIAMLRDPAAEIRQKAADRLGKIGEHERKAKRNVDAIVIGLATALSDPSEKVFREALTELDDVRSTSPESIAVVVPALIAVRARGSSHARADVLDVLGRIGEGLAKNGKSIDAIRDALIASLTDNSSRVRINAIEELADIRATSTETFRALVNVLADDSKSVRNRAEAALIELGTTDTATLTPMLANALGNSTSPAVRGHIVDVLGAMGEKGKVTGDSHERIVQTLLIALQDPHENVRRNAADELGEMRTTAPEVLSALKNALEDNSKNVRNSAKKAIRRIEGAK